ncbi:MAG: hypothetical protein JSS07_01520 [Proteobacteria bacterium]|nr:hypothetical protein [Pseudomonadota bacterium]
MKKATQAPSDPFAQYFKAYQELTHNLENSNSVEDIALLTNKVNSILQLHYKAIMSFYDKQYRQILNHIEENNNRIEGLRKKSAKGAEEFIEQHLKQSEQLMQQNMTTIKEMFKKQPNKLIEQFIDKTNENLNTQIEIWNDLYTKQQEVMQREMRSIHEKANALLENSEQLRQDSLAKYKELEKTMHDFLANKQKSTKEKRPRQGH